MTAAARSASRGRACIFWSGSARSRRLSKRRSAGGSAAAIIAASRFSDWRCRNRSGEKYLPMYNLQQQYIEQFLHDAVATSDLIDMRWQSELSDIEPHNDRVSVRISSPAGDYRLDADYVLAADGARSPVRSMLGLRLKGDNYEGRYVIADIRMDHDFPTERRAFFEPAGNPGGTVLIHKQPENIWRVDYQLREGESEAGCPERKTSARASARYLPMSVIQNRGSWNGGASIPPTRCASMTTVTAASSSSAMPRISCRSSACAG